MHREFLKHKIAYIILILGLVGSVVGFLGVWPNVWLQRAIIAALVVFYFLWGVVIHKQSGNLSNRIIQEYLVVALLAGGMLLIITF